MIKSHGAGIEAEDLQFNIGNVVGFGSCFDGVVKSLSDFLPAESFADGNVINFIISLVKKQSVGFFFFCRKNDSCHFAVRQSDQAESVFVSDNPFQIGVP